MTHLSVSRLGVVEYQEAWSLQEAQRDRIIAGVGDPILFLLQHPPTITLGTLTEPTDLETRSDLLHEANIAIIRTNRGGMATYHGPGQLVGYPVLNLRQAPGCGEPSVREYLRNLEEALIRLLSRLNLEGRRVQGAAGVWIGERKIASIGVAVRRWVTTHGFALNVDMDLAPFHRIRPCGFDPGVMTSIAEEGGRVPMWNELETMAANEFAEVFGFELTADDGPLTTDHRPTTTDHCSTRDGGPRTNGNPRCSRVPGSQ